MKRRQFTAGLVVVPGVALMPPPAWSLDLSEADASAGVRAALEKGAVSAVGLLGRVDGFLGNPKVRIPLPGVLRMPPSFCARPGRAGVSTN